VAGLTFSIPKAAWTADYLKITGELDVDLRNNIAAEARAKIVYERLINFCDDVGTKDALQFLMTREITHMKAFALTLQSMSKPAFSIGRIAPTPGVVNQFFNESTGSGDMARSTPADRGMKGAIGFSRNRPPSRLENPVRRLPSSRKARRRWTRPASVTC
jgi:Mn-containing catalase